LVAIHLFRREYGCDFFFVHQFFPSEESHDEIFDRINRIQFRGVSGVQKVFEFIGREGYSDVVKTLLSVAVAVLAVWSGCATPAGRPMKLVILGEKGTMYVAKYTVDGLKQEEAGLMPDTVRFGGRNVEWEVLRPSGTNDFRVEFCVGELRRTSTTSAGKSKIRGAIKYDRNHESYWAHPAD